MILHGFMWPASVIVLLHFNQVYIFVKVVGCLLYKFHPGLRSRSRLQTRQILFILFDRDVSFLIRKTCEELVTESLQDVAKNGYPNLLDSIIGKKIMFKVEKRVEEGNKFDVTYPVWKVCTDDDIIAMFQLPGADLTPTMATFVPPFTTLGNDIMDLDESSTEFDSQFDASNISLAADDIGPQFKFTPAKRKLDEAFCASQDGCSNSGMKLDHGVEDEDDFDPFSVLVPVKIEKD